MNEANTRIREITDQDTLLAYIDVASAMLTDEGLPREDIFVDDELHLNERGYEIWTRVVREALGLSR
jgi:hypothetical protein